MRTFFSSTFIEEKALNEVGIYYPIELEYYKITNEQSLVGETTNKFGIKVLQKSYKEKGIEVEEETIDQVSNNEQKIEEILEKLGKYGAMPVHLKEMIHDFMA